MRTQFPVDQTSTLASQTAVSLISALSGAAGGTI
jgi:hypothetical protein